ncbi:hypothetical protein [Vibrio sp. WXL103]|uniref:hypothetical protein n=1 Tax=Vibrio sp. WXL103 TaxID=3450710 RepID=UPI003EC91587
MNVALEFEFYIEQESIAYPEEVTLSWSGKNVELKQWIVVFMFIIAVSRTGIKVGSSYLHEDLLQPALGPVETKTK